MTIIVVIKSQHWGKVKRSKNVILSRKCLTVMHYLNLKSGEDPKHIEKCLILPVR